ncbi:thioredoxin family protein [Verrucomicrobiaceae bacterium 5K15]|uniref:Thioredoxin family protein n=1 Tax=Oceaniferula flava TaxID=2800421 RepID=A0AAE2SC56_9BACT|nr:thioredoxin family protein [Oceaniferula flavus]MBK1855481.1 thioredoxin family protein [Oceaniferula flavus]MBM1136787.1 thioredoxin family protein [Oceaniferula flavus]
MKAIKHILTAAFALATFAGTAIAGDDWLTDVDAGIAQAKKENKAVMVEFTGSDWCPPCIMMHKKVFSKSEFTSKASEKFVLVKIDIPNKDKELKKKNSKVLQKYGVRGVPTVILFDADGKEFNRFTASQFPDVDKFLAHLDSALEKKDMD